MLDAAILVTEGCGAELEGGVSPLRVVPEHLGPLDPIVDLLGQQTARIMLRGLGRGNAQAALPGTQSFQHLSDPPCQQPRIQAKY
jgi:hypothetical protein